MEAVFGGRAITTEYVGGMTSGTYYMCDCTFMAVNKYA